MPETKIFLDAALLLVAVLVLRTFANWKKQPAPYPPGPKGYPLIGNLLDMPALYPWRTFTDWGDRFGDIIYLNILGQPTVILNSAKQATAMLDRKSGIYSDRPVLQMGGELVGWNAVLALSRYTHRFREYRRYMHRFMGTKALVENHHELIEDETHKFLRRVLESTDDIGVEIRRNAGAIILKLAYGYSISSSSPDPLVSAVNAAVETLTTSTTPGAWLVDVLPFLRHVPAWVPGARFKRTAAEMREVIERMADEPYEFVKRRMAEKTNVPNYTSDLLESEELDEEKEYNIKWSAASLYSGGADTTVSAIHSFVLAMALYPDVQKRAQAEIDLVVGTDRLPTFADREQLPYVEAIVKETLRWSPVAPLTLPHRLMEDDIHDGYFLPAGTIVFANLWSILHDPHDYPNPLSFDPSRFLSSSSSSSSSSPSSSSSSPSEPITSNNNNNSVQPDPYTACFGYGRRLCPGMHFAEASLFMACVRLLAVFDVGKKVVGGKVVEPRVEYTSEAVSHPKPFSFAIRPRSVRAEALIREVDGVQ
ncbi:cytochrome P450 [Trametopsis cervina]|nr:cytochrome P450 [Trametopsis cervina]